MPFKLGDNAGKIAWNFKDLAGQRFGKFVVIETAGKNKRGQLLWKCRCDCGSIFMRVGSKITVSSKLPHNKSCGCTARKVTHGKTHSDFYSRMKRYGLSYEEVKTLFETHNGHCGICKKPCERLHIDHDHVTGKVRGMVCTHCNSVLGYARDSVTVLHSAIEYLQRHVAVDQRG